LRSPFKRQPVSLSKSKDAKRFGGLAAASLLSASFYLERDPKVQRSGQVFWTACDPISCYDVVEGIPNGKLCLPQTGLVVHAYRLKSSRAYAVLRILLTKRSIWPDLAQLHRIGEIRGDTNPLRFVESLPNVSAPPPDFAVLGSVQDFERPDTRLWNSESSVSEFLGELVFRLRARAVVELECFVGWTSAHLALGLHKAGTNGKLWCVDSEKHLVEYTRANLVRLGLDKQVTCLCGRSADADTLAALPSVIDVVFIDTSHRYEDTRREIALYSKRLAPTGFMILHDTIHWPGVRRAVAEVLDQFNAFTFATEYSAGLSVLWPKKSADNSGTHAAVQTAH
jgi:predicted O-methyltransferase YrrM